MSLRRAPSARRMPISRVRSKTGEHDVHDANAANQQRYTRNTPHDDVKYLLRFLTLAQQLLGNSYFKILNSTVPPVHDSANDCCRFGQTFRIGYLNRDLRKFRLVTGKLKAARTVVRGT